MPRAVHRPPLQEERLQFRVHGTSRLSQPLLCCFTRLTSRPHAFLQWLGITAGLAENLRKQWSERVWRYGLRIVEAPVYQISTISSRSAFRAPLHVQLALQPPDSSDFDPNLSGDQRPVSYFYEAAFLNQQGFVLDVRRRAVPFSLCASLLTPAAYLQFESDKNFPPEVDYQYPGKPYYDYSQFVHRESFPRPDC